MYRIPYHHSSWVLVTKNNSATSCKFRAMMSVNSVILGIRQSLNSFNNEIFLICFVGAEIDCRRCILSAFSPKSSFINPHRGSSRDNEFLCSYPRTPSSIPLHPLPDDVENAISANRTLSSWNMPAISFYLSSCNVS